MIMMKSLLLSALLIAGAVAPGRMAEPEYRLVVVSESGDIITWIRVKDFSEEFCVWSWMPGSPGVVRWVFQSIPDMDRVDWTIPGG
jgi:hypothetical protein